MCGRFLLRTPPESWPADLLSCLDDSPEDLRQQPDLRGLFEPRSNICPTQAVLSVIQTEAGGPRHLRALTWGLVPPWAKEKKIGASMINARSETVHEKPSFRGPLAKRRCLVVADAYYEWVTIEGKKQPMRIEHPSGSVFCFAAIWEVNLHLANVNESSSPANPQSSPTQALTTCTIITTASHPAMQAIHDRMPVVIQPEDYRRWLDPAFRDVDAIRRLLVPADEAFFTVTPVDKVSGK